MLLQVFARFFLKIKNTEKIRRVIESFLHFIHVQTFSSCNEKTFRPDCHSTPAAGAKSIFSF